MNRNHVFDSIGPDLRMRGTAQQLFEKYLQLGRDATSIGDRVAAEGYFQHAEHYFRILGAMNQVQQGGGERGPGGPNQGGGYNNRRYEERQGYDNGAPQDGGNAEESPQMNGHAEQDGRYEAEPDRDRETVQ